MDSGNSSYRSGGTEVRAFMAAGGKELGVIIIHEIWGLNENIRDIAKRVAEEGYTALAPHLYSGRDYLSPEAIERVMRRAWSIPQEKRGDPEAYRSLMKELSNGDKEVLQDLVINRASLEEEMLRKAVDAYRFLVDSGVKKAVAMGFCMGGGLAFQLATEVPLDGVIVFYGRNPQPVERVSNIKGPILGLYAGDDPSIDAGLPELMSAVIKYRKDIELRVYSGRKHAFFNDRGMTYDRDAAEDAWLRVKAFLRRVQG